jgi:molecular chaperone GrpE
MTSHDPKDQSQDIEETPEEITPEVTVDDIVVTEEDEITRLQSSLARSQADYQNLVMRSERDKADMLAYLSSKLISPLLKEMDNLDRAVALKE